LLDEVVDLSQDTGTSSIREELWEDFQQRQADAVIKSAIGSGALPSAEVVEERLLDTDEYVGIDALEAEEEAVLDYLLEPRVDEEDATVVATIGRQRCRKAPVRHEHPIDNPLFFDRRATEWKAAFADSMAVLNRLRELAGTAIGLNRQVSLVRTTTSSVLDDGSIHTERKVMFVNWKVGQVGKVGQEVKDDCDGYIIFRWLCITPSGISSR
jgi:hypothetical protein